MLMELERMLDRYMLGGYEERTHPASVSELRVTRKKVKSPQLRPCGRIDS